MSFPRKLVEDDLRKPAKNELVSDPASTFLHDFCFKFLAEVLP